MISEQQIREARSIIDTYNNVEILEDVYKFKDDYLMKISITLDESNNAFIPLVTHWVIIFHEKQIDFYPAKDGGIKVTFQHQSLNCDDEPVAPYYQGKLCLDRTFHVLDNQSFDYLPKDYIDIFKWYLDRAIEWITKASKNELVKDNDPFEIPLTDYTLSGLNCLYKESNLDNWAAFPYTFGYAQLAQKKVGEENYLVLKEIYDIDYEESRGRVFWGNYIENANIISKYSVWIKLKNLPLELPWSFPDKWESLIKICQNQEIDLLSTLTKLFIKSNMISAGQILCLTFPIPAKINGPNRTMSWLFIELPAFNYPSKGFRNSTHSKLKYYLSRFKGRIKYCFSENIDNEYLLSRGKMNSSIAQKNVAIIGLGAIGSLLAENLSRLGFDEIALYDSDHFTYFNIARHSLNLDDNGKSKVIAIKDKITKNNPHLIVSWNSKLQPDNIDKLKPTKIIIDCSANPEVIKLLKTYEFKEDKLFVIAAVGYGATDFIVYFNKGNLFNADEYQNRIVPIYKKIIDDLELTEQDLVMQGVGCYHPVFPARFDDINIWSSLLVKAIEQKEQETFTSSCIHWKLNKYKIEVVDEWSE